MPPASNNILGLVFGPVRAIFLCETFLRNTTPSTNTLSSMVPPDYIHTVHIQNTQQTNGIHFIPGITLILTYCRMSMPSPPRTSGSTDDTTSRTNEPIVSFHKSRLLEMLEAATIRSKIARKCSDALYNARRI